MPYDPLVHGPQRVVGPGWREKVFNAVRSIPKGRVSTYGEVAGHLGLKRAARQVGFALAALSEAEADVPWQRVVTASGRLSVRGDGKPSDEQIERLLAEGIRCDAKFRIERFAAVRWHFGSDDLVGPGHTSATDSSS